MNRTLAAIALAAVSFGSLAAGARADCPHAAPVPGSACVDPGLAACTYTVNGETTLCSCRDGHWACGPMPAPHS